ncbi:hypothetical protein KL921_003820 [Ogataea angusta]|uniref:Zn(2)-C6 fungal-type domain-containing protein n=1 Tax=Pichia angusta TaxID=870730 RepID=A0ABQ7RX85_PICAN|nr:hypothetical protein KL921_003820 [Ogataea angusta]KAG7839189.1 hypothetical protein KL942_003551 [Ogataea angusta]KAG7849700.1 hypothetical protein KL940_002730 [Ogataea angusta]
MPVSTGAKNHTIGQKSHFKRPYTRPCDACAHKRVRCDVEFKIDRRCTNCLVHGIECTNVRVKQRSGPRKIHKKTEQAIKSLVEGSGAFSNFRLATPSDYGSDLINPATCEKSSISLSEIRPYLRIYKSRYYALWPVLSVDDCLNLLNESAVHINDTAFFILNANNASLYALSCALCAVIARHTTFWSQEELDTMAHLGLKSCPPPEIYVREAERAIYMFDLDGILTEDQVLTSFFLHIYFSSLDEDNLQELVYLRQAISCAQMLHLRDSEVLGESPKDTSHRFKKIYYLLLITERYVSFKKQLPVILEPTMPLPSLEDDEAPDLLSGFIELAQVFSVPDCAFFNKYSLRGTTTTLDPLSESFDLLFKNEWIQDVQTKLSRSVVQVRNQSQKVNILISRTWLQSIAWLMAKDRLLLMQTTDQANFFDPRYPIHIAKDFLIQTKDMPYEAFETNGSGVIVKLSEVANALQTFIRLAPRSPETALALDELAYIHGIIMRQNSNSSLGPLIHPITETLEARRFGFYRIGWDTSCPRIESVDYEETANDHAPENVAPIPENLSLTPLLSEFEFPR